MSTFSHIQPQDIPSNTSTDPPQPQTNAKPTKKSYPHSCQPLLGVNLSLVFMNLYFPYAGRGLLFFAGGSSILNSNGMCGSGRKKQCCAKYTCTTSNLTSNKIS